MAVTQAHKKVIRGMKLMPRMANGHAMPRGFRSKPRSGWPQYQREARIRFEPMSRTPSLASTVNSRKSQNINMNRLSSSNSRASANIIRSMGVNKSKLNMISQFLANHPNLAAQMMNNELTRVRSLSRSPSPRLSRQASRRLSRRSRSKSPGISTINNLF
jgi:hypothetical protein